MADQADNVAPRTWPATSISYAFDEDEMRLLRGALRQSWRRKTKSLENLRERLGEDFDETKAGSQMPGRILRLYYRLGGRPEDLWTP